MSIERYDMEPDCTLAPMNADMRPRVNGDWVRYEDYVAELAAARDDAEVHRIERRRVSEMLAVERAAREKAEAEAARLLGLIEQAPHSVRCSIYECARPMLEHDGLCGAWRWQHTNGGPWHEFVPGDCNCWKAAALAQEGGR